MRSSVLVGLGISTALVAALPAAAQERSFNFSLLGGVSAAPDYPGADSYGAAPLAGFTFGSLKFGGRAIGGGIGSIPENGLKFGGSFRVVGSRKASDNVELTGLKDIDTAVELGLAVTYQETNWNVFGNIRQGFGGHHGVTGTIGSDLIFRPNDRLTIAGGPRINLGDSEYAQTYFGVSAAEAGASTFGQFDAGGGVLGAGVTVRATYRMNERWALEGVASYEKLLNDAQDSTITKAGSDDQWTVGIGLSRAFTLRF
ncbi:MAG: MipA/OmpV family protein [Sulfitobacter sp.]